MSDLSHLMTHIDNAIEKCSTERNKFMHLLTTISCFKGFSVDNVLILSEKFSGTPDVHLVSGQELLEKTGIQPDPMSDDRIELLNKDREIITYYDLNQYIKPEPEQAPTSLTEVAGDWFRKMNDLLILFRKGSTQIPSVFSSIRWEKLEDPNNMPQAFIVDNNGRKELVIMARPGGGDADLGITFWPTIKACILELFERNSGFDSFSKEIKTELAGNVALCYFKEKNLNVDSSKIGNIPTAYLKKYTDPEDFKMYVNLILLTFNMISPGENTQLEPPVPEQTQTGLNSDDLFAIGVTMDEDTMNQINEANKNVSGTSDNDSGTSGGFVPVQTEANFSQAEPEPDVSESPTEELSQPDFSYDPGDDQLFDS